MYKGRPKRPPKTPKERKWAKRTIELSQTEDYPGREAAKEVYAVSSEASARAIASQNFQRLSIGDVMDKKGLTEEKLVESLKEGLTEANKIVTSPTGPDLEMPDYAVRHKYLETGLKLKGLMKDATVDLGEKIMNLVVVKSAKEAKKITGNS